MDNNVISYYLINLDRSSDRLEIFNESWAYTNLTYTRVPAVDGADDLNTNPEAVRIFNLAHANKQSVPRRNMKGYRWTYNRATSGIKDGFSFMPRLLPAADRQKALILSNLNVFDIALNRRPMSKWTVIFEDDAVVTPAVIRAINESVRNDRYDVIALDNNTRWGFGTNAMLYRTSILPRLIDALHPLGPYASNCNHGIPWDWLLFGFAKKNKKTRFTIKPICKSYKFASTIEINR